MFECLRAIHNTVGGSALSSSSPSLSDRLSRAAFASAAQSEFRLVRLHEAREGPAAGADPNAQWADFTAHTLREHLRAAALESARAATAAEKTQKNEAPVIFLRNEEDAARVLWGGRTMALAATTALLESRTNAQATRQEESRNKNGEEEEEEEENDERRMPPGSVRETVRVLRAAFPALRAVLRVTERAESDADEEAEVLRARTRLAKRPRNSEGENNNSRKDSDNLCTSAAGPSGKRPFSFTIRVNEDVQRSADNAPPCQQQQPQQQQQRQSSAAAHSFAMTERRQATLCFDSAGGLSLSHPPPAPTAAGAPFAPRTSHAFASFSRPHDTSTEDHSSSGDRPYANRANRAPAYAPAHALSYPTIANGNHNDTISNSNSHNNNNNNNAHSAAGAGGGFVTAGEQWAADVRAGRAKPSALQRRVPALGLRRSGFTPPFQSQAQQPQQQQQQQQPHQQQQQNVQSVSMSEVFAATAGGGRQESRGAKEQRAARREGSEDAGADAFPASLLLPDGSVPPLLLPLDPKLVSQVAMEILEHGAGAASVGWDDIAGLEHAKRSVEEAIVWPLRRPDLFVGLRDPPRGLLLFGPPGTGKTMIARAIANRAQCTFLNISASSLMSKWMGDGEKLVRCLFAVATVKQPSVIFIDEIDSLLSMRGEGEMDSVRRVKTEFLVQLDGVATDRGDRVLLIGATNRPEELDEAARRRMEKRLYIPLPDTAAREELVKRLLYTMESQQKQQQQQQHEKDEQGLERTLKVHAMDARAIAEIAAATEGYSGADLKQVCREAAMGPLREVTTRLRDVAASDLRPIQRRDFTHALRRIKPSVGVSEVARYVEWNEQFGSFSSEADGTAVEEEEEEEEKGKEVSHYNETTE